MLNGTPPACPSLESVARYNLRSSPERGIRGNGAALNILRQPRSKFRRTQFLDFNLA
jgi:hypothetical protein